MQTAVNGSIVKYNRPDKWLDEDKVKKTFDCIDKGWDVPKIAQRVGINESSVYRAIDVNKSPFWRKLVLERRISLTAAADSIRGANHNNPECRIEDIVVDIDPEIKVTPKSIKATDAEIEKFIDVLTAFGWPDTITYVQFNKIAELLGLELVKK